MSCLPKSVELALLIYTTLFLPVETQSTLKCNSPLLHFISTITTLSVRLSHHFKEGVTSGEHLQTLLQSPNSGQDCHSLGEEEDLASLCTGLFSPSPKTSVGGIFCLHTPQCHKVRSPTLFTPWWS